MKSCAALVLAPLLAIAGVSRAEVLDSAAGGFTVRETVVANVPASKVWESLIQPAGWWSSSHTFSHDARSLTLAPKPGGFWLETLPSGGGVRHMVVVYVDPPAVLRLEGALGPLQDFGVAGHLTFRLAAQGAGTLIVATYDVGGHAPGGLDRLADPVDRVLGEQLTRLKARAETGVAP
jgi:hypothetical protein